MGYPHATPAMFCEDVPLRVIAERLTESHSKAKD
jgi:hypothetical protein